MIQSITMQEKEKKIANIKLIVHLEKLVQSLKEEKVTLTEEANYSVIDTLYFSCFLFITTQVATSGNFFR